MEVLARNEQSYTRQAVSHGFRSNAYATVVIAWAIVDSDKLVVATWSPLNVIERLNGSPGDATTAV